MSLAASVSETGQVGHHWKERPIVLANFICLSTGEHQDQEVGVGGVRGVGRRVWGTLGMLQLHSCSGPSPHYIPTLLKNILIKTPSKLCQIKAHLSIRLWQSFEHSIPIANSFYLNSLCTRLLLTLKGVGVGRDTFHYLASLRSTALAYVASTMTPAFWPLLPFVPSQS